MQYLLAFDEFDNPMHLSKVGNWVITYISPQEQLENIQLAITYVLPREANEQLQPRRIVIKQTSEPDQWLIEHIECYNSVQQSDVVVEDRPDLVQLIIENLISEFKKYDVEVTYRVSE